MDIFKKKQNESNAAKPDRTARPLSQTATPKEAPVVNDASGANAAVRAPSPVISDSQTMAEARVRAREQLNLLEQKIAQERESWVQKVKEKSEEQVSCNAKLEMLTNRIQLERERHEAELSLMQQNINKDLKEIDAALEAETAKWAERLSLKDKDIEDAKHRSAFEETQKKIEAEQSLRALKAEKDATEQKYKSLQRSMLEEQNKWLNQIRLKEEEIVNIKTQIALHEEQLKTDDEKNASTIRESQETWHAQIKEMEERLEAQRADWARIFAKKEEELAAIKTALEQKLSALAIEAERKESDIRLLKSRMEGRIKAAGEALNSENARWQLLLSERDEEFKKLRVELMLRDSQEKTERQKKYQEFKDAESSAAKRIREAKQKLEDEKQVWQKRINDKDEELKNLKIQAELKIKEIQDEGVRRQRQAEEEKSVLSSSLSDLQGKLDEERESLQKSIAEKDAEIIAAQAEWQNTHDAMTRQGEAHIKEIRAQKEAYEKEVLALEAQLAQEKQKWNELTQEKEKQIAVARSEYAAREALVRQELNVLEEQLRKEHLPLLRQVHDIESKVAELQRAAQIEITHRETQKKSLQEQFQRREENLRQRLGIQIEKIKDSENSLAARVSETKVNIALQAKESRTKLDALEEEGRVITSQLSKEHERIDEEKAKLSGRYKSVMISLEENVKKLENEYDLMHTSLQAEIEVKSSELAAEEARLRAAEERIAKEIAQREKEFADLKTRTDSQLAQLKGELEALKKHNDSDISAKLQQIEDLRRKGAAQEAELAAGMESARQRFESELKPMAERKEQLHQQLEALNSQSQAKLRAAEGRISALRSQQDAIERDFLSRKNVVTESINVIQRNSEEQLRALQAERAGLEASFSREMLLKEEAYAALEKEISGHTQMLQQKIEAEREESRMQIEGIRTDIDKLYEEISRVETEYPEILATRQEEIVSLEKQVNERAIYYQKQTAQAEKSLENYQRRAGHRIEAARSQLEQIVARHKTELGVLESKMDALKKQTEEKEHTLNDEQSHEGKIFVDEKFRLEKQKIELEEKLKEVAFVSRDQISKKEKEIAALQAALSEKERLWEEAWRKKEAELEAERVVLTREQESLEARLKNEEEISGSRLAQKEDEINLFMAQSASRLKALENDIEAKRSAWEDSKKELMGKISAHEVNLSALQQNWRESITRKEKEHSALKSNLEFWELRTKTEEEKRLADWEKEKFALEEKIRHATGQITSLQQESAGKLAEREKQLGADKESARLSEESKLAQWRQAEDMLTNQRDALMAEISTWEKKIKDEASQYEKESKELDKEIEKLKLESALKDAGIQASRHKTERDWFKALRRLEGQLESVSRRYSEEKDAWAGKIHLIEEETNTFRVRLAMREDRRHAEINRRQEEMRKMIAELEGEVKGMYAKYGDAVLGKREWVSKRTRQLEELRAKLSEKEIVWQSEQAAKEASLTGVFEQFGADLSGMEKSLREETGKFEALLNLKQKQLQNIMAQMAGKEEELAREREFSQKVLSMLNTKAAEFKQQIDSELRALRTGKQEQRGHMRIFDEAMELYAQQNFAAALERLDALIRQHPRFPGALQYMALCHFEQGRINEAVQFAQRAFELDPNNESLKDWITQLKQAARSK